MQYLYTYYYQRSLLCLVLALLVSLPSKAFTTITMQDAVKIAIQYDPWLRGNQLQEKALRAASDGAKSLPDPILSMGLMNLPTDGFAFDQEPMSQLKVGVAQTFPRGDSLAIKQQLLTYQADQHPFQRADRKAKIRVAVSLLWIDALKADHTLHLIQGDRVLFEQLVDIVKVNYSSALGNTRQQDVISAQLELARLDDRLTAVNTQRDLALSSLSQWLPPDAQRAVVETFAQNTLLPTLPELDSGLQAQLQRPNNVDLLPILNQHPALMAISQSAKVGDTTVKLAKQKYQAQWGLHASYAYRDDNPLGQSRADFFSIGVTVALPLFGTTRQDNEVSAARLSAQAIETEKRLLQLKMLSQMQGYYQQERRFAQRALGYTSAILPQNKEHAAATLSAYTHDDGDFSEVMRARITQLNAQIESILIHTEKLKMRAQLNYFLAGHPRLINTGAF